jgi:hypothetical protein
LNWPKTIATLPLFTKVAYSNFRGNDFVRMNASQWSPSLGDAPISSSIGGVI